MVPRLVFLWSLSVAINACGGSAAVEHKREPANSVDAVADRETPGTAVIETININTAPLEELQRLPHIGASTAQKIIEHRETYGLFKRPEELMQIQGISDVRFRRIRHLIRVK